MLRLDMQICGIRKCFGSSGGVCKLLDGCVLVIFATTMAFTLGDQALLTIGNRDMVLFREGLEFKDMNGIPC
jgi:hypothetical protein